MTATRSDVVLERTKPHPRGIRRFFSNPWGKPRFLAGFAWLYILWSIAPVVIAVQISFNAGRSRSVFSPRAMAWGARRV